MMNMPLAAGLVVLLSAFVAFGQASIIPPIGGGAGHLLAAGPHSALRLINDARRVLPLPPPFHPHIRPHVLPAYPPHHPFIRPLIDVFPIGHGAHSHRIAKRETPNNNGASAVIVHQPGRGQDLTIEAQRRLWSANNGRSTLDSWANFQRHFGGPSGSQRPNYGAGIRFEHKF